MDFLSRLVVLAAILFAAHYFHIKSIGVENLILGCITGEFKYPPRSVFWWFAENMESYETKPGHIHPGHFAFNECIKELPVSHDCMKLFAIMEKQGVDFSETSNVGYDFPLVYTAMLQCSVDGVDLALSLGASRETRPGKAPYDVVSPYQFLYSTSCDNKLGIKALLDRTAPLKYSDRPTYKSIQRSRRPKWNQNQFFKINKNATR